MEITSRANIEPLTLQKLFENGMASGNERNGLCEGKCQEAAIFLEVN